MNAATRRRLERLLTDLLWLACDSGIDLDGAQRDAIGELRSTLHDAVDAS